MRSKRYQTGGIKKQRGRWIGMWWVDGRRRSRRLGLIRSMSKTQAREAIRVIVDAENAKRREGKTWRFGEFVEQIYFPYYSRKWKGSTRDNNVNRVSVHLVALFRERELSTFKRDELQDVLDAKVKVDLSFSVVDHLRWDMKQVFDMAVAEGHIERNPALLSIHAERSEETRSAGDDDEGGAICFRRSGSAGTADCKIGGSCRDASR